MKALLKYEFRKTWGAKLMVLGIAAVAEIAFLIGIALGENNQTGMRMIGVSAPLLMLIAIFGLIFIGIQSVVTLHRDMNTKQGYMLYMTPRSSYQVLGAKFMENGLSLVLAGAIFFLLGLLDVTLLLGRVGQLDQLWKMGKQMLEALNTEIELNTQGVLTLSVSMLVSWLATVAIAYLADIVSSALLNGKKFNGIVTFLLFVLLSAVMSWLQNLCMGKGLGMNTLLLVQAGIAAAYSVVMYFCSAYIMDHYLSV